MFDSFIAVPLHFTIEFLGFLVAAGGALLALSRPTLVPGEVSNRITVGLGFGVIAIQQVLHGGSFILADGEQLLVAMRALGLALVLVGIVGGVRVGAASGATSAAYVVKEPLLFAPASAAFVLAIAAFWGSLTHGPKAFRRLAIAALLLGGYEVMTAAAPAADFSAKEVPVYAFVGHGAKALGFLMIAAWVWTAVRSSIRTRFVASFAALLIAVVLALSTSLTGVLTNSVERDALDRVERQLDTQVRQYEVTEPLALLKDVRFITTLEESVQAPLDAADDVGGLAEAIRDPEESVFEFDFLLFMDPKGVVLDFDGVRSIDESDQLKLYGSRVIEEVVRDREESASPIAIGSRHVAIMAARRVPAPGDPSRTVGIVAGGQLIDHNDIERLSATLELKGSLIANGGRVIASRLPPDSRDERIVPGRLRPQLEASDDVIAERQLLGGDAYFSSFATIDAQNGETIALLVFSSPATNIAAVRESLIRILFIVAMAVGMVALGLAWLSGRRITRPIQLLTDTAQSVREGDLQAQAPISGDDEVGRLGETFNEMTSSLFKMTNDLREAAREEYRLRARIETIIQSMADGLVATDAERKIVAFNREAEVMTGLKARHALGKDVSLILDARDSHGEPVPLPVFDLLEGFSDNVYLARKNGDRVPIAAVSAVLRDDDGDVTGAVTVLRDMSREREIERMKSEFLANISHELRTPLTPIKGYAEILGRKEVPREKVQKFVAGILESTARLERIVELLVDFSAMEAGRLAPRSRPVDVAELLTQLATEWELRTPNHRVVVDLPSKLPKVSGDERLLRRSLTEVIDNAVKFSPQGGTITLAARGSGAGNGERRQREIHIVVTDEGIGIPPEDISKIFTDFHQLDGSETRSFGGLGLGLAFVQRIVDAHEGTVAVDSAVDGGTTLTITLPAARRARSAGEDAKTPVGVAEGPVAPPEASEEGEPGAQEETGAGAG